MDGTITANDLITLGRIVERTKLRHGRVAVEMIVKDGHIVEAHLRTDHRTIVKVRVGETSVPNE